MVKHRFIYLLILIASMFSACELGEDEASLAPESLELNDFTEDQPIFRFFASAEEYSIQAGFSNFYMFTEYELVNGVHTFISRFAKLPDCTILCDESLVIKINDFQTVETSADLNIEESLQPGEYSFTQDNNTSNFSRVSIEYTGSNGVTYFSDRVDQDSTNRFIIESVEDFANNENGEPTKKLTVSFDCELANETDELSIFFTNARATIAVAFPE